MKQILDKVNEIAEVLNDTNCVPNMEWVKNNVNELQNAVKEICNLPVVINRRELLIDFLMEIDEVYGMHIRVEAEKCADNYLKSINSL